MRFSCLVLLLLATMAFGQTDPQTKSVVEDSKTQTSATPDVASQAVGPNDAVIVINDFCPGSTQTGDACKTIITRAQFEKLAEALEPDMPLPVRLKVAYTYARILRMAPASEQRGLDKTPAFEEEMRYARMQLLSQDLSRALQREANNVPDADIAEYYHKNESAYEQATLARIFIPFDKRMPQSGHARTAPARPQSPGDDAQKKSDEAELAKLADDLRARAVNGEDPDKLQAEAYAAAGMTGMTPKTKMEKVRRDALPPSHEKIMDLKPGDVSAVVTDPAGAHFIYQMINKQTLSIDDVRKEIRDQISAQRYKESMKKFQGDAIFSDAYFNPPGQSPAPHHHPAERRFETPAPLPEQHN